MTKWPKISSYFTQESLDDEKRNLFSKGAQYVGHKLMAPKTNDYHVVSHSHDRYTLFNHGEQYRLISNVCPHRQAQLLTGQGNTKNITCNLHCWTFNNEGALKGTPHFKDPVIAADLENLPLNEWNGLLFKGEAPKCDLKAAGVDHLLNFNDHIYTGTETEHYQFNWKTFVEIYLENYHVFSMHPGLKKFVGPSDLEWVFGDDYSIQKVGLNKNFENSGTPIYEQWHQKIKEEHPEELPRYGAIWMFIYPNIMIEWYPQTLVISTVYPTGPSTCVNHVEFYYPQKLYSENPDYFVKEKAAYMETAVEDNEACMLLERGRRSLFDNGQELYGPVESFLEAGVGKFYEYLRT